MPPNTASLGEAIDYRRCPSCGSDDANVVWTDVDDPPMQHRHCRNCQQNYRVEFSAVRVEAE